MEKINFKNGASGNTHLSAENLNTMQDNIEESCVIVSSTQPQTNEKVWFKKGKNLFDGEFIQGAISATGSFVYYAENIISKEFIEVIPGANYVFSCEQGIYPSAIITYDKDKKFMDRQNGLGQGKFLIDENTHYVILQFYNENGIKTSDVTKAQFEQNTSPTTYEAYITPAIYVKNGNVYEEFLKKEEQLIDYRTTEQKIGTWTDGKTLYRKVIEREINTGGLTTSIVLDNIEIKKASGVVKITSHDNFTQAIPFYENDTTFVRLGYSNNDRGFRIVTGTSEWCYGKFYITIEYTKN